MNPRLIAALADGLKPVIGEAFKNAVKPLMERLAAAEARQPEKGEPGKGVDIAELAALVAVEVARAVDALPKPENGKDADPELIARLVAEEVIKIPPPADGKNVDPALVEELVTAEVTRAVDALPKPENGKNADPDLIARFVNEAVAKIPPAAPGKDVDQAEVTRQIAEQVATAVAALPKAKDGSDTDPEVVKALVAEAVSAAVLKATDMLPTSFMVNEAGLLVATYPAGGIKEIGRVRGGDGASVMDGFVDEDEQLVLRMSDGRKVPAGIWKGEDGKDAKPGEPGPRGRDSIEIRIQPGIDETRTYPEGTCVAFRGGVIRAERNSDPIVDGDIAKAGWRVIMEGIAEESERTVDDGRTLERVTTYTSGKSFTRQIVLRTVIDRGVWKEGPFQRDDGVTWGGSFFIAQRDTTTKPETPNCDWRLAVKRGQNGKDGKAGERGTPGQKGDRGERGMNGHG